MLLPARFRPVRSLTPPVVVASATACVLAAIGLIGALAAPGPRDPCAMPGGYDLADLPAEDRAPMVARAMACRDLEEGRITGVEYAAAGHEVVRYAPPLRVIPPLAQPITTWHFALPPGPVLAWATSVRGLSTQYDTDAWAATQALGAPDVYPASGDNTAAWASEGEDDRTEYLDLGFAPQRMSAVRVYETYNPGAVSRVVLTFSDGTTRTIDDVAPGGTGADAVVRRFDLGGCSTKAVIAVKLTIDSKRVAGWNEIDAVGAETCD